MRFSGVVHKSLRKKAVAVYTLPFLLVIFSTLSCSGAQACLLATPHHTPICDAQCNLNFNCSNCDTSVHGCASICYADVAKNVIAPGERLVQPDAHVPPVIVSQTIWLPDDARPLFDTRRLSHESAPPIYLVELNLLC